MTKYIPRYLAIYLVFHITLESVEMLIKYIHLCILIKMKLHISHNNS